MVRIIRSVPYHCTSEHQVAFLFDHAPKALAIPVALRAPEVILRTTFDHKIDILSFGCYLFEMYTGQPLFSLPPVFHIAATQDDTQTPGDDDKDPTPKDDNERNDDDHLLQMLTNLGPLPRAMFDRWPRRMRYCDANMKIIRTDVGPSEDLTPGPVYVGATLEQRLKDNWPRQKTAKEHEDLIRVLRSALEYDYTKRLSATELLRLDWFNREYDTQAGVAYH